MGVLKIIHLVDHIHCRLNDWESTECTRSLAKTKSQVQNRVSSHRLKHHAVPTLIALVRKDGIVEHSRIELVSLCKSHSPFLVN